MNRRRFVSEPIEPSSASAPIEGEPQLPPFFTWRAERLEVGALRKTWRTTKNDRGDEYLNRHWFEFDVPGGKVATVYFDRAAKRGTAHWWLFTIDAGDS